MRRKSHPSRPDWDAIAARRASQYSGRRGRRAWDRVLRNAIRRAGSADTARSVGLSPDPTGAGEVD